MGIAFTRYTLGKIAVLQLLGDIRCDSQQYTDINALTCS